MVTGFYVIHSMGSMILNANYLESLEKTLPIGHYVPSGHVVYISDTPLGRHFTFT